MATLLALATLTLSACGDDDDATAGTNPPSDPAPTTGAPAEPATRTTPSTAPEPDTTSAPGSDTDVDPALADYCQLAVEINSQAGPPTPEQLQEYASLAPHEIAEQVSTILAAVEAADGDFTVLFTDPALTGPLDEITAFETEACGIEAGEAEEGPPQDPSVTALDPAATRVDVVASEYEFRVDLPSAPGRYSFVMANEGEETHILILVRLEEGATIDEVMASEGATGVIEVFESSVAPPGAEGILTADLAAGDWVMLCPIPNKEGHPHVELGMIHEFTIA